MKQHHFLLRMIWLLALCAGLTVGAFAEDAASALRVMTTEAYEDTGSYAAEAAEPTAEEPGEDEGQLTAPRAAAQAVPSFTSSDAVLEIIIRYEGFVAYPMYDSTGGYIGYGSNYQDAVALFGENCAPITEDQAKQLTRYQLGKSDAYLNGFLSSNGIVLNQNQFDALSDFTYNIGIGWTTYKNTDGTWCMLKELLLKGASAWNREDVMEAFGKWVNAGGQVLPGLVKRRAEEAELFLKDADSGELVYSDVLPDAWYYEYVLEAKDLGIMQGMGNGTFSPNSTLTRAQLVKALANYAGAELDPSATTSFSDVEKGTWYAPAIAWAAENGYVDGYANGTFQPNLPVSRQQICTILSRYLQKQGKAYPQNPVSFTDESSISDYAREHVAYCASIGLITGMKDGSFNPLAGAKRAEAATILVRMAQLAA